MDHDRLVFLIRCIPFGETPTRDRALDNGPQTTDDG